MRLNGAVPSNRVGYSNIEILILGCGYTGARVARRFLARGARVIVTSRDPLNLEALTAMGAVAWRLDCRDRETIAGLRHLISPGVLVLHSIPPVRTHAGLTDSTPELLDALGDLPGRMMYLSTTGVYGATRDVDETTPPAPVTARERLRLAAERAVRSHVSSSMVLRPAAIYGPGRGVHGSMREGRFRIAGDGSRCTSRIHVDDLAAHVEAALLSRIEGAFPVADEDACPSRDVAEFCSRLLGLPMPAAVPLHEAPETRRADRRVDGSAVRRLLGISLRYPSYRVGIPAAIGEESRAGLG